MVTASSHTELESRDSEDVQEVMQTEQRLGNVWKIGFNSTRSRCLAEVLARAYMLARAYYTEYGFHLYPHSGECIFTPCPAGVK